MLGVRPKPREYGYDTRTFDLGAYGVVQYAQWLHPSESEKQFTQGEVDHLRRFIGPGDVAIDVGAHSGDTTLPIALAAGPTGRVLALEPNPYVFRVLTENARLNPGKVAIEPLPFAATSEDGLIEFEYSDPGFCNGGRHEGINPWLHAHPFKLTVEGRNLEKYLRSRHRELIPRLRYIKTDAEGYDLFVLRSLRGLIQETRPYIKSEIYKHTNQDQRQAFVRLLRDLGYEIRKINHEFDYLGEAVTWDKVMQWRHYDIFGIPQERVDHHLRAA